MNQTLETPVSNRSTFKLNLTSLHFIILMTLMYLALCFYFPMLLMAIPAAAMCVVGAKAVSFYQELHQLDFISDDYEIDLEDIISDLED